MLTIKQDRFCNLYIELGNASDAYRGAYSCENMKDETINRNANKLLNNNKIRTRVRELQEQLQKRSDFNKDEAVFILANIARVNPLDYVEIGQDLIIEKSDDTISKSEKQTVIVKDLNTLTKEQQRCIKSIIPTKDGIKLEFESKTSAIDRLSKMLGWDSPIKNDINIEGKEVEVEKWLNKNAK